MGRKLIKNRSLKDFSDYLLKIEEDYIQSTGMVPYVWELNDEWMVLCAMVEKHSEGTTLGHKPIKKYSVKRFTFLD